MALDALVRFFRERRTLNQESATISPPAILTGLVSSAKSVALISQIEEDAPRTPSLIIVPSQEAAEILASELRQLAPDRTIFLLPAYDTLPFEMISPSRQITSERAAILGKLLSGQNMIVIASLKAALQKTVSPKQLRENMKVLRAPPGAPNGEATPLSHQELASFLIYAGYQRQAGVESVGEFSVRGGIIDIFPPGAERPVRVEYLGDEIETIREFDPATQRTIAMAEKVTLLPPRESVPPPQADEPLEGFENWLSALDPGAGSLLDYFGSDGLIILDEPEQLRQYSKPLLEEAEEIKAKADEELRFGLTAERLSQSEPYSAVEPLLTSTTRTIRLEQFASGAGEGEAGNRTITFETQRITSYHADIPRLAADLQDALKDNESIWIVSRQTGRLSEQLGEASLDVSNLTLVEGDLHEGFVWPAGKLRVLTDSEIYGPTIARRAIGGRQIQGTTSLTTPFEEGCHVVHVHYGIGRYRGLHALENDGISQEFMMIEYADEGLLYVPIDQMALVYHYKVPGDTTPKLSKLTSSRWEGTREKVRQATRGWAEQLLKLYAARKALQGMSFPADNDWQIALERAFPYPETNDQITAIRDVKKDMEYRQPMDRLICGDVGYGKTEVAVRAAFKAVTAGKQVAVLVPTTLLAEQHLMTFRERFAAFPFTIEMLSRFRTPKEQAQVVRGLASGGVDVVIGTHRLIQKDILFKDLGLLIIDEEQRFGVAAKERIKAAHPYVDVLTLSATPIPRTLYLSLSSIREMSLITTPPQGRTPIRTTLTPWNDTVIREAIVRELERGGQVFFVHNNIERIQKVAVQIQKLVPSARIEIGHGQMDEGRLEKIMARFMAREIDILVCTTIIESGLDLPNVNTIIIDHADRFGLADLYQLRGRVGRGSVPAYAYLIYVPARVMTETARERLQAIKDFTALGSGYRLALRDLEIRGAGTFLGRRQHGHMVAVGFDLYTQMLEQAVKELKDPNAAPPPDTFIALGIAAYLPVSFVEDETIRLDLYRRLHWMGSRDALTDFENELKDRFGKFPAPVKQLMALYALKIRAAEAGLTGIESKEDVLAITADVKRVSPARLAETAHHIFSAEARPTAAGIVVDIPRKRGTEIFTKTQKLVENLPTGVYP